MVVCTMLGIIIDRLAYKPLRQAPVLAVLITAIGMSYFLQNSAQLLWTSNPKVFTSVVGNGSVKLFDGALSISYVTLVTILACVVIMTALVLFVNKTKTGKAMRAVSEDKAAAQLMGHQRQQNYFADLRHRFGFGCHCRCAVMLCVSNLNADHWFYAWY